MADECTLTAKLEYSDSEDTEVSLLLEDFLSSVATKKVIRGKVSVGTSEEAIPLGEATSPGWFMAINRDETNYVEIKTATGGTIFAKMKAGEPCGPIRLGSGAQVPYWIANTAACQVDYLIIQT